MRRPVHSSVAALALGAAVLAAVTAHARPYPTNACAGDKQAEAGAYCRRALRAWAQFAVEGDEGSREAALAKAAARLAQEWTRAEARAARNGADCTDTTLASSTAGSFVDAAVDSIVEQVQDGLVPGNRADGRCARAILRAAADTCGRLLAADARFTASLDAARTVERDHVAAHEAARFAKAFARVTGAGCGTTATEDEVEALVDEIHDRLVRDTTSSPNVSDTGFTLVNAPETVEYQGHTLHPVCATGGDYGWFAKRGTVNKLLVYYQGGGACWENLTCTLQTCDQSFNPSSSGDNPGLQSSGFADIHNPANPFRDWNIVFVPYCSCDIHFGDAAQDYEGSFPTIHIEHRGFQNAKAIEKWAREHFLTPERVFVTGSSAGAYGAWFHGPLLHEVWPQAHFDVLADAGNGVVTPEFLQDQFPHWNFAANLPPGIPGLVETITDGTGIAGYTKLVAERYPETRWAHYATAFDGGTGGQTGFYNVMRNPDDPGVWTFWWNASCAFNQQMRAQAQDIAAAVPDNYRYFIGTGSRHTMWGSNKVYTDTAGGIPLVVDWVRAMLDGTPAWTNVECTDCGVLLSGDTRPNPLQPPFAQQGSKVVITCPGTP